MGCLQTEELLGVVADRQAVVVETERSSLDQVADFVAVPGKLVGRFNERDVGVNHMVSPYLMLRAAPCGLCGVGRKPPQDGGERACGSARASERPKASFRKAALAACRLRRAA